MNNNHPSLDDDLTAALSDTDVYEADPRPEHIEELRAKLLARTTEGMAEPASPRSSRRKVTRRLLLIGLPIAATILIAIVLIPAGSNTSKALADILQKTRAQKWIHGTTTWTGGEKAVESESWISPTLRIAAVRHPAMVVFVDYKQQISTRFKPGSDSVYLVRPTPLDYRQQQQNSSALEELLTNPKAKQPFSGFEVSALTKKDTKVDGKPAREYSFRLEQPGNPNNSRSVKVLVDVGTGLIATSEEQYGNGLRLATKFDYPDDGPRDVYALGIPKTVKVVDRLAATDVTNIASRLKEGRTSFDDYDAVYVQHVEGMRFSLTGSNRPTIRRVRRSGNKHRVDYLLQAKPGVEEPAADADLAAWWRKNRNNYWSVPMLICDGRTITTYSMVAKSLLREGKPNLDVELRSENSVQGFRDDPTVSWPHLMPEYNVRPHLWTTIEKRTFELEPMPDDGPDGTVRLIVNYPGNELMPERARYWLDPDRDFCLRTVVAPVVARDKKSIAYINTEVFEEFQQSPKGHWYATRSRRMTSNGDVVQVRDYYVDFESELRKSLFEAIELGE
jgi:hypothetical protein